MNTALLKSSLWALVGVALYRSNKPPYKTAKNDKRPKKDGMNSIAQYTIPFNLGSAVFMSAVDILTIQSSWFRGITSYPTSCNAAALGTPFLAYFALTMLSFVLRLYSFRALGDLFTFYVTIRPNHRLVTGGPYQFVRHPSYSGLFGVWTGSALLHFSECDSLIYRCFHWVWLMVAFLCTYTLATRAEDEDEILRQTFGEEWEAYRMRVPYRFIPGIY